MRNEWNAALATSYTGPVTTASIEVGGRTIQVVRPMDPDRLLDDPEIQELCRRDDYMPYWAYLWPGAYLLSEAVARENWQEGTRALEIGCGLGLAGLTALGRGLCVEFSDYDETPLRFVTQSALANSFAPTTWSTRRIDWRDPPDERYGVILGADVLYEHRLIPLVADVLQALLAPDGFALIAGPYRVATEGLEAALESRGLAAESEPIAARGEFGPVRGLVHKIRRKIT